MARAGSKAVGRANPIYVPLVRRDAATAGKVRPSLYARSSQSYSLTIMTSDDSDGTPAPEPGYLVGAILIAGLVLPQVAVLRGFRVLQSRNGEFYVGVYLIYVGSLFLSSYYWSDRTFVLRGVMWVCEKLSHPSGRRMAFFYFALCAFLGSMSILAGCGMIEMPR